MSKRKVRAKRACSKGGCFPRSASDFDRADVASLASDDFDFHDEVEEVMKPKTVAVVGARSPCIFLYAL